MTRDANSYFAKIAPDIAKLEDFDPELSRLKRQLNSIHTQVLNARGQDLEKLLVQETKIVDQLRRHAGDMRKQYDRLLRRR